MHVELRYCDGLTLCLCGVHIQYRKDIYMYHVCEGLLIDGFVYGNGESFHLSKYSNGFSTTLNYVSSYYVFKCISKLQEYYLFYITVIYFKLVSIYLNDFISKVNL